MPDHIRHVHIWEIDSDGRGPNYYEANEMGLDNEVIDHDVPETFDLDDVLAMFPDVPTTIHYSNKEGW